MGATFTQGHALIVGIGGARDLPDTVTDAEGIAKILKDSGRCAYPKKQVQLLTGAKSGRDAVLTGLDHLAKVPADSSVIVYFSGHGEQVQRGKKSTYYLMTHGYDLDDLENTAISGAEFADKLRNIKAARMLVLLDCCHAGGFDGVQAQRTKSASKTVFKKSSLPPEAEKIFTERQGRVLIASSKASEVSYPAKPYSVFTMALIGALSGEGNAKEDGYVRVVDLALYTREAVARFTQYEQTPQHPTMDFEKADNFVVAYYAAGNTKTKGLPKSLEKASVQAKPNSSAMNKLSQQDWEDIRGQVIKIREQHNYYGPVTKAKKIVFNQPGWNVGTVNQVQNLFEKSDDDE